MLKALRQHWMVAASTAVFLLIPALAWWRCWNVQTAIYWATGMVVLHYTFETFRMREELTHQNRLAVQPLILANIRDAGTVFGNTEVQVVLRNIGKGPALFVRADEFGGFVEEGGGGYSFRIPPVDYVESGMEAAQDVELIFKEANGKEVFRDGHHGAVLKSQAASKTHIITVRYKDIDGGRHWAKTQMGKGGIRLLEHGRT